MTDGPAQPKRILALSTTALGDTLLSTPALRAIRHSFPQAHLDLLVHRRSKDLVKNSPHPDRVIFYRNNGLTRLGLAIASITHGYDLVFILHANTNIKKLLRFLKYRRAVNVQEWDDPKLRLESVQVGYDIHTISRRLRMVEKMGGSIDTGPGMEFHLDDRDRAAALAWLESRGVDPETPLACIHPGAADKYKIWPADRFGAVARHLTLKHGLRVIVTGVGRERDIFEAVQRSSGQQLDFAVDFPLGALAALIGRSRILVTNDTGPLHVAITQNTASVSLFGSTDAATIGPFQVPDFHLAIQKERTCSPCLTKRCRNPVCMAQIEPDEVFAAVDLVLTRAAARGGSR